MMEEQNKKTNEELMNNAIRGVDKIKKNVSADVIKDYEILQLVNTKTMQDTGFAVKLQLNTHYEYDEAILSEWKKLICADDWYISVKRNQLHVSFIVRFKNESTNEKYKPL